jgi:biopolymer transport protein ExbB
MVDSVFEALGDWMHRGGWVMWPLGLLSLTALTLIFERCWFWAIAGVCWRRYGYAERAYELRQARWDATRTAIASDHSIYGDMLRRVLAEQATDAAATQAIEDQRHRMERFMPTLSTIITAAPMLGILGTVMGIISAFHVLSEEAVTDPSKVAGGIAEALLTTVFGLLIAIPVLFPYNAFRVQIDRALSRMETLVAAAQAGAGGRQAATAAPTGSQASPSRA